MDRWNETDYSSNRGCSLEQSFRILVGIFRWQFRRNSQSEVVFIIPKLDCMAACLCLSLPGCFEIIDFEMNSCHFKWNFGCHNFILPFSPVLCYVLVFFLQLLYIALSFILCIYSCFVYILYIS